MNICFGHHLYHIINLNYKINIVTQKHCWVSNEGGRNFYQLLKKLNSSRGYYKELSEILDDDFYTYSEEKPQTEEVLTLPKEYKPFINSLLITF